MLTLTISDLHDDARTLGVSRREEVRRAVRQAMSVAIDRGVHLFIFAGDLADPDDPSDVLQASSFAIGVAGELADHGIESVWIAGNHDVLEDGEGTTTLTPLAFAARFGRMKDMVHVFEGPRFVMLGKMVAQCNILALPFTASTRPASFTPPVKAFCRSLIEMGVGPNAHLPLIVIGHLQLEGAKLGEESREMARGRDLRFPSEEVVELARAFDRSLIIHGHYHEAQTVELAPGYFAHIPGSLVRLNFGEERHTPSFLIAEV